MYGFLSMLEATISPVLDGAATAVTEAATNAAGTAQATTSTQTGMAGAFGGTGWVGMIAVYAVVIGALYWFTIRPQRKREKEAKELQSRIGVGDNIVTSSGMYGKVVDVGDDCFVIEFGTNRGIKIPVRKSDVLAVKTPNLTQTKPDVIDSKDKVK